jgi:murein DD-endopeptidase MepM/ murein hydrolase activator NlpD
MHRTPRRAVLAAVAIVAVVAALPGGPVAPLPGASGGSAALPLRAPGGPVAPHGPVSGSETTVADGGRQVGAHSSSGRGGSEAGRGSGRATVWAGRDSDGTESDGRAARGDGRAAPWMWPTGSRVVGRPWEGPADEYAPGHRGIDVPAPLGAQAVAVADGTVAFAGQVGGRPVVTVDHGGGLVSTLDSVTPLVGAGDAVEQGQAVGRVAVGHCAASEPCVHLGARLDDRYVDPTPYLPAAAWPVLLPEDAWDP